MTEKELKSKIADIIMEAIEEYNSNEINRPMIASVYAGEIISFINSLPEEPISEDLEKAAEDYGIRQGAELKPFAIKDFKAGAQWREEQMMKDSVLCGVDGWFINNDRNCRKNGRFYKYYVSTISHDKPLPMENGKDYRLITIKED